MAKSRPDVEKILCFGTGYQVIYGIEKQISTRTWRWKLIMNLATFVDFNHSFKWVKRVSSRWKPTYQYHVSNHNSAPNETEITASSN